MSWLKPDSLFISLTPGLSLGFFKNVSAKARIAVHITNPRLKPGISENKEYTGLTALNTDPPFSIHQISTIFKVNNHML